MRPILFELPWLDVPVYAYGAMLYLSFIVGYVLALRLGGREGLPRGRMEGCFAVTALCALAAARLLQVATHPESFHSLADVVRLTDGGMVAYGGFLGGLFGSIAFCRAVGLPILRWGDCAVPALCTGLLLTRIGCLLAGCDFGKPWDGPWAVPFPAGSPAFRQQVEEGLLSANAAASLPVHPTQIYESVTGVVLLALVLRVRRRRRSYGEALAAFAVGYAVLRFGIEMLRDDAGRGFVGPLSTSQAIALLTLVAALVLFARLRRLSPTVDSSRVTHQGGMSPHMRSLARSAGLALAVLGTSAVARAETTQCTEIAALPFGISSPGIYCLKQSLTYADWNAHWAIAVSCDDVVIDLNGHVIDGMADGVNSTGILSYGARNVTVRNGTLRGFRVGVSLDDNPPYTKSRGHVVEHVRAEYSRWMGLRVAGQGSVVRSSQVLFTGGALATYPNPTGIWMNGPGVHVHDNEVVDTIEPAGGQSTGIFLQMAPAAVVERNVVTNARLGPATSTGIGFAAERGTAVGNRVINMKSGITFPTFTPGLYMDNTVGGATTPYVGGTAAGTTNFSF